MAEQFFVDVNWLHDHLDDENLVLLDHPYGLFEFIKEVDEDKRQFADEHLPGAIEINNEELQGDETDLNLYPAERLKEMFLSKGVTSESLLVVYSDGIIASSRVALAAYYLGVDQVKILLGGIEAWKRAGYPVTQEITPPRKVDDFLCEVPKRPEIILSTPDDVLKAEAENPDFVLANIRSWEEFEGGKSGYPYIEDTGSPLGSVYAKSSSDRVNVKYLVDEDGTVGDLEELLLEWQSWGITPDKEVAFFCGAGWRAATAFFLMKELGWKDVKVYDGGWYQWNKFHQKDPKKYPIQTGDPRSPEGIRII